MTIDELVRAALDAADTDIPAELLDVTEQQLRRDFDTLTEPTAHAPQPHSTRRRVFTAVVVGTAIAATFAGIFAFTRNQPPRPKVDVAASSTTTATAPAQLPAAVMEWLSGQYVNPPGPGSSRGFGDVATSASWVLTQQARAEQAVEGHVTNASDATVYLFDVHGTFGAVFNCPAMIVGKPHQACGGPPATDQYVALDPRTMKAETLFPSASAPHVDLSKLGRVGKVDFTAHTPIPARDKVVIVTGRIQTTPSSSKTVVLTDPHAVAQFIALFDTSHLSTGGVYHCPLATFDPELYTISFASSRSAPPDVTVTVADTGCRDAGFDFADGTPGGTLEPMAGYNFIAAARTALHS